MFEHNKTLVVYLNLNTLMPIGPGPFGLIVFYKKKDACGKYLLFATLGSYVACFGARVFKFLWRIFFFNFCGPKFSV